MWQVAMATLEEFEQELQEALAHLYDPDYRPSESLCLLTGCDAREGALGVQSAILHTIKDLEPPPDTPRGARTRLIYDLLHSRFVLKLTQEETAERLCMSVASAWRAQREAIHVLFRLFWEHRAEHRRPAGIHTGEEEGLPLEGRILDAQLSDWRSQVERELASLQASAPGAVADVAKVVNDVIELESALTAEQDVRLDVGFVQPDMVAMVHPSVLYQMLVTAIGRLARYISSGQIAIFAGLEDGNARVVMTAAITADHRPSEDDLIRDVLVPEGASIGAHIDRDSVFLWLKLPSLGKITVLVVDDNPDMADLYRRSTEGTSYHIVHIARGQDLLATVEAVQPDVIVLDVMLPDIDGWKLLMRLYEDPATRPIPVIVCSVVREEDLALSLGAALYLAKPVRARQFIQALDQALLQASAGAPRSPANSATAC
jgi:CheY-like chemotaxis protein